MAAIITVENISKLYRIGAGNAHSGSLRDSLGNLLNPSKWLRRGGRIRNEEFLALRDVTFEVERGEILGIIGRNGAGKSTLLKILSRITKPTTGRIKLYGRVGSLLEVGTGFHPELTGRENVFLNGAILGMTKAEIERKFDEIVDFSEIEKFIDTPVKRYSSGMHVRLAFAVAAHLEPEILIVDEVLAVGDVQFQKKCLTKIGEVARGGCTVLFVSHNVPTVVQLCTACVWIDRGRLKERGEPNHVVSNYLASARQPDEADGIITRDMHYHEPRELAFTRIAMTDGKGHTLTSSCFGSPLDFRVEFCVREKLDDAMLALGIHKGDERVVCVLHHTDGGLGLLNLLPGDYVARLSLIVPLAPGRYCVGVTAKQRGAHWSSTDPSLDYVWKALTFDIEGKSRDGRAILPTDAMLLPESQWRVDGANDNFP